MPRFAIASFPMLLALGLALSACTFGNAGDSVTTNMADSDHQSCQRSCNNSYSVCGDSRASRTGLEMLPNIGGGAACSRELQSCLRNCH